MRIPMDRFSFTLCLRIAISFSFVAQGSITTAAERSQACWKDYPIPTKPVDYRQEFAAGTLLPDMIVVDGRIIERGMSTEQLTAILGIPAHSTVAQQRTANEQCEYLFKMLEDRPTSMHLYKLSVLGLERLSGFFGTLTWELTDIGTIRAFWRAESALSSQIVYMYHISPVPIVSSQARIMMNGTVLSRVGQPRVDWDIERNQVTISGSAH
jgi:hypothetical protein